jgi:hypothetical protein
MKNLFYISPLFILLAFATVNCVKSDTAVNANSICSKGGKNILRNNFQETFSGGLKGKILHGNELDTLSEVAFYYDSLRRFIIKNKLSRWDQDILPEVVFVPGWGEWVCNEKEIIVTDTIASGGDETNEEYVNYIQDGECEVEIEDNFMQMNTNSRMVMRNYLNTTQIKLFHDAHNAVILGIKQHESSQYGGERSDYAFFMLSKGKWKEVEIEIPGSNNFSIYFKDSVDVALIKKYNWIDNDVEFNHGGDTICLQPYFPTDMKCYALDMDTTKLNENDKSAVDITVRRRLCEYEDVINSNGFFYVFDKKKIKFRRADPVTKSIKK